MATEEGTRAPGSPGEGAGSGQGSAKAGDLFVRRSSGLTRQVGAWDALMFGSAGPGITVLLVFIMWTAWLYPGMYYPGAVAMVAFMIPISLLYWLFAVAMPRSGGEYVYVTRTLGAPIGLMCSWIVTITILSAVGLVSMWTISYGVGNGFAALSMTGNYPWAAGWADFFWSNWGKTVGVLVLQAALFYILLRGTRLVLRLVWANIILSVVTMVVLAVVIIGAGGHATFVLNWNAMNPASYQHILAYSTSHGYLVPFTIMASIMGGMTYICQNTTGATFTANIAGEVQGVQKSQLIALVGSLLVCMVLWFIFAELIYAGVGAQFNSALSNLAVSDPTNYPAIFGGREPFIGLLLVFFTKNPIILMGFALLVAFTLVTALLPLAFGCHRNVFAWSFDRIIPAKFAELDRRYRQPWLTVVTCSIISTFFGLVYIWRPNWLGFVSFVIILWFLGWLLLGIGGIIFPWRRPEIFRNAPPIVRSKWLGIPVISILGAATVVICIVTEYFMFKPILSGTINKQAVITAIVIALIPFLIFYVMKWYRSKGEVPLSMQFSEIPPE